MYTETKIGKLRFLDDLINAKNGEERILKFLKKNKTHLYILDCIVSCKNLFIKSFQ